MSSNDEQGRRLKELEARSGGMLPGVAGICMFMLVLTILNAFAALSNRFGTGAGKYGVLALCTMLAVGIFGLLRMKRWGWVLILAGALTLSLGYLFVFEKTHQGPYLVQGLFALLFFLYLVRPEVRGRLR